jgi:hypothetical protein
MTMGDSNLRRWVSRTPSPYKLRFDQDPGKCLRIGSAANRWSEAEKSILAMNPMMLEALDAKGEVLRVMQLREEEPAEHKPQTEPWPNAPEAQMAQVITASNDRAASRHEAIFKMSFDALKEMYQACLSELRESQRRCAQLEAALQKELSRQEVALPVSEDENLLNTLVAALAPRLLGHVEQTTQANGKDPSQ